MADDLHTLHPGEAPQRFAAHLERHRAGAVAAEGGRVVGAVVAPPVIEVFRAGMLVAAIVPQRTGAPRRWLPMLLARALSGYGANVATLGLDTPLPPGIPPLTDDEGVPRRLVSFQATRTGLVGDTHDANVANVAVTTRAFDPGPDGGVDWYDPHPLPDVSEDPGLRVYAQALLDGVADLGGIRTRMSDDAAQRQAATPLVIRDAIVDAGVTESLRADCLVSYLPANRDVRELFERHVPGGLANEEPLGQQV
jgi:hypothetical protein